MGTSAKVKAGTAGPGSIIFTLMFLLFALFLLSQLDAETKFSARGKLFAQPRFWPAVAVAGMVVFGMAHLVAHWFTQRRIATRGWYSEVLTWCRALEYLVWFMVYVAAVPVIGYLGSTIIFTVLLSLRQGYRGRRQLVIAVALAIAIVVIFKAGLSVKIPGGAIYEYLPAGLRSFMILNF